MCCTIRSTDFSSVAVDLSIDDIRSSTTEARTGLAPLDKEITEDEDDDEEDGDDDDDDDDDDDEVDEEDADCATMRFWKIAKHARHMSYSRQVGHENRS